MEDAGGGGRDGDGGGGADLDVDARGAGGEDGEEDGVDVALARRVGRLVGGVVADGAAIGAGGRRVEPVPEGEVLGVVRGRGRGAGLVGLDVVGQVVEPGGVGDAVDVPGGAGGDAGRVDRVGADVVRLAPVVPRQDLDELGLQVAHLGPARVPQVVAAPQPVLAVLRQVAVEPGADGHHVRPAAQRGEVLHVGGVVQVVGACGPRVPAQQTVDVGLGRGAGGALAGVVRDEEAAGLRFDVGPV